MLIFLVICDFIRCKVFGLSLFGINLFGDYVFGSNILGGGCWEIILLGCGGSNLDKNLIL